MKETTRPVPFFVADNRALDFLNSVATPSGSEIEWLSNGSDLLDWLEQAELVPAADVNQFREMDELEARDAVAAQARELRDWLRGFVTAHAGRSLDTSVLGELDVINGLLARDNSYRQVVARNLSDQGADTAATLLRWRRVRRWRTVEDLLVPIAEAIGDLVCSTDFEQVKLCEGPTCTLWFHDISKNHSRRWCTMAVCGNRAKAALHRAKKKSAGTEPA